MCHTRHDTDRIRLARRLTLGIAALLSSAVVALGQPTLTFTAFDDPEFGGFGPAIIVGPDAALWLTDGDGIFRLSVVGDWRYHPLPPDGQPYPNGRGILGLAVGSDGAIWFTESVAGRIGRITTDGVITQFPLPAGRSPQRITAGPDGALWYTEFSHRVGRITTQGSVTEFALPPCGPTCTPHPLGITTGPDGALWFTNLGDSRIWQLTTAGAMTPYGPFVTQPGDITTGPDGALWFTAGDSAGPDDNIGRITTSGAMTAFPLPIYQRPTFNGYNNLAPSAITTGPDGALWFTAARVNVIGRVTTAGLVTLYDLPEADDTTDEWVTRDITTGPDNALWITSRDGSRGVVLRAALSTVPLGVTLDVKPGSCRNPVNPGSKGVLPVAIVGTDGFDVEAIDSASVRLNGVAPRRWTVEDVAGTACDGPGRDGYRDLALKFPTQEVVATLGQTPARATASHGAARRDEGRQEVPVTVTGALKPEYGGAPFSGTDVVTLVGKR